MRLARIIKKTSKGNGIEKPPEAVLAPEEKVEQKEPVVEAVVPARETSTIKASEMGSERRKERVRAFELYARAIALLKDVLVIKNASEKDYSLAEVLSSDLINELNSGKEEILVLTAKTDKDKALLFHMANVFILSVKLGMGLGFGKDKLVYTGVAALLHGAELDHSDFGKEFLVQENKQRLINSVMEKIQHKERYINVLEEQELQQIAGVIGLIDIYESLSHADNPAERMLPHEVLKMFIESHSGEYDGVLIKKMIETLSIYPPGSFVQLDTDEIGEIVRVNGKFPTRPVVRIFLDNEKRYLASSRYVDLTENPMLRIKNPVDDEKLDVKDKKFILKQKINKRWVL